MNNRHRRVAKLKAQERLARQRRLRNAFCAIGVAFGEGLSPASKMMAAFGKERESHD